MIKKGHCLFLIGQPGDHSDAGKCGLPTKYAMVMDDDGHTVRKYDSFCPKHLVQFNRLKAEEEAHDRGG